jgi:glutathione S-transferase
VKSAAVAAIRRELALVDAHLSTREFVLGSRWSALDAYLFAMARWGSDMVDLKGEFPNVTRHWVAFGRTEAVRRCVALERERPLPTPSTGLTATLTLATFVDAV